jgi:hypothetical protein
VGAIDKTWLDESLMPQYKQMTTIALGRILVAIGNAILEEQSPTEVESVFRLKRPRGLDAYSELSVKRVRREPPAPPPSVDSHAEAVNSHAEAVESCPEAVESCAGAAESHAEAVESQAEAPRAKAKKVKRKGQVPVAEDAIDWNEILEPCPIVEATTAAKVLQVARQKYGVAAARMHFSRDKQSSLPGPDGKCHRVFKYGLPRGLAWKLK